MIWCPWDARGTEQLIRELPSRDTETQPHKEQALGKKALEGKESRETLPGRLQPSVRDDTVRMPGTGQEVTDDMVPPDTSAWGRNAPRGPQCRYEPPGSLGEEERMGGRPFCRLVAEVLMVPWASACTLASSPKS